MDLRLVAENPDLGRLLERAHVGLFTLDAEGRFAGWSAGAETSMPSTALSTEMAGVMMPSP